MNHRFHGDFFFDGQQDADEEKREQQGENRPCEQLDLKFGKFVVAAVFRTSESSDSPCDALSERGFFKQSHHLIVFEVVC